MRTYIPYIGAISITPADGSDLAREVRALSANATGNLTIMLAGHPVLTVTGATNPATPIEITTAEAHGLETNDKVYVSGVGGNTNANGLRSIIKTAYNKFTLTGSTANADYTSGGAVRKVVTLSAAASVLYHGVRALRVFSTDTSATGIIGWY